MLRVLLVAEVGRHGDARTGFVVLDRVEPEVRRLGNQHAAAHVQQRPGHHQPVEKHGALVRAAVVIGILQDGDAADGTLLAFTVKVPHEAAHLHDPQAPLGIELRGHRRLDHRLAGEQFHPEAGPQFELFHRLVRRQWRRGRDQLRGNASNLRFTLPVAALGVCQAEREHRCEREAYCNLEIGSGAHERQLATLDGVWQPAILPSRRETSSGWWSRGDSNP